MNPTEKAQADAQAAAQRTLQRAATFIELHSTSKPWFQKLMRVGSRQQLTRVVFPGVLEVFDPKTGEVLARSVPGNPKQLAPGFVPSGLGPSKEGMQ